ncbi:MAG: helix-turn-helix domain-containing protein [Ruminococcus flavefaciens]|nr:helix-turn-helix domain-containing protein [Ruminococcus flavefaciens]
MTVGKRIKEARKKAGLTQKELGERLGISYQTVAQWENDLRNPKQETLQRIANALNISLLSLQNTVKSADIDFQMVMAYTGLTETALYTLTNGIRTFPGQDYPPNDNRTLIDVLNAVLSDSPNFLTMLSFLRIATASPSMGIYAWGDNPPTIGPQFDSTNYLALACECLRKIAKSISATPTEKNKPRPEPEQGKEKP